MTSELEISPDAERGESTENIPPWRQGELIEVTITDLSDRGDGVGRSNQRVVFVPDTVTGDRALVRLMHVKPSFAHAKLHELIEASPHRVRPGCIVADKCGGCQWQHVDYEYQREAKRNQVVQALQRIGGFDATSIGEVLNVSEPLHYRNKATYPLAMSQHRQVQAGYYQKGTHQIVNLNQCPIQDERLNPFLAEVKQDIQQQGWRVYDEKYHRGQVRHLSLRVGQRTGEVLLTLVTADPELPNLEAQAQQWLQRYSNLVGVSINLQRDRTNAIFGAETYCIAGQPFLSERFAGLIFHIRPDTFFQVHTEQTEALLASILQELNLQGDEQVVDAYCGIGTLTLPIAQRARTAIGLEIQPEAIEQAQQNAILNGIENVTFQVGAVEEILRSLSFQPDVVLLDPPRKGCDGAVLATLREQQPKQIVYVSCNAATLARDLKLLCAENAYQLTRVQPADFFPQTAHVECAAFLRRVEE